MNKLLAFFQRNLCSDWLPRQVRTGSSCPNGIACNDPAKEKEKLVEQITKNLIFGRFSNGVVKSGQESQNKENVNDSRGFIVPILLAFINQYNLVRSRRPDISLVLFGLYGPRFRLGPLKHKTHTKKKQQTSGNKRGKFLKKLWSFALTKG